MSSPLRSDVFESDSSWPFLLREAEVTACVDSLAAETAHPQILRVFGVSGSGKSFFVKELLTRLASHLSGGVGLYLDVPAADLEATAVFEQLEPLLTKPRQANRASPHFVSKRISSEWRRRGRGPVGELGGYLYRVLRDLTAQVPVVGPFVKAVMPISVPEKLHRGGTGESAIRFLVSRSKTLPVVLVIDNLQFLPALALELLETEMESAGSFFRLVVVERIRGTVQLDWCPEIPNATLEDVQLGRASVQEVVRLTAAILPNETGPRELAEMIHRRSDGNLKSVWFQLRLISERRASQGAKAGSYAGVIESLSPIDQAVLRVVVFLLGGLSVSSVTKLFEASDFRLGAETTMAAIADLAFLGLVVVNSEKGDRVRVEHEIVSQVVSGLTPEEEKLELRQQLVHSLALVLDSGPLTDTAPLYDRLVGIVHESEVREQPRLQSLLVSFVHAQHRDERFSYLATICRDSVFWDVLDVLPSTTVEVFLDAIQKCSLFSFGLVATEKLKRLPTYRATARLYEAKYLVQLFRYSDAQRALADVPQSKDREVVEFIITINLCHDEKATKIAVKTYTMLPRTPPSEESFVILRNSGHLFRPSRAKEMLGAAHDGFRRIGSTFGVATTLNNLGIVEVFAGKVERAQGLFEKSRQLLKAMQSNEAYQPTVNLGALCALQGDLAGAERWVSVARDIAPRSLAMDTAMLDFNEAVIALLAAKISLGDAIEVFRRLHVNSTKTMDVRFIDVVGWCCASLETKYFGFSTTEYCEPRIGAIRDSSKVGVELFLASRSRSLPPEIPFVLSPHWRY
jgi:hypothetical protein